LSRPYKTTGKAGITNVAVEWIAHVSRIQYIPGSSFGRRTYTRRLLVVLLSPSRQIPGEQLELCNDISFHITLNYLFT